MKDVQRDAIRPVSMDHGEHIEIGYQYHAARMTVREKIREIIKILRK